MKTKLFLFLLAFSLSAIIKAENILTYVGDNARLNKLFELSDGTILVTGRSDDLNWLPGTTTPVELDVSAITDLYSNRPGYGFIMQLSSDLASINNVIHFPEGTVENIYKIRTTTAPGQTTGELFVSGRVNGGTSEPKGYFIARLDDNFINAVPSIVEWYKYVEVDDVSNGKGNDTRWNKESAHVHKQPWDVTSQGHVYYADDTEFSHSPWVSLKKIIPGQKSNDLWYGSQCNFWISYDPNPHDGLSQDSVISSGTFGHDPMDSVVMDLTYYRENGALDSVVTEVVKVDSVEGFFLTKTSGTGGRNMHSLDSASHKKPLIDENGNVRLGAMPHDINFKYPYYDTTAYPSNLKADSKQGPAYYGHMPAGSNTWGGRFGEIVVDKRNDQVYFSFTQAMSNPYLTTDYTNTWLSSQDYEPFVVSMNDSGRIDWWAWVHEPDTATDAAQVMNDLAIDYGNDELVVLGRSYDTCQADFWKGNELLANPGGNGVLNKWTGSNNAIWKSWIGRYSLDSLLINRATYVAEFDKDEKLTGTTFSNPVLSDWVDPNLGDYDLAETICEDLVVDQSTGDVCVACFSDRVITTKDAHQQMIQPDQDMDIDSMATRSYFVRKYNKDLSKILYSSLITGEWDIETGTDGSNTHIEGVLSVPGGAYAVGHFDGTGNAIPLDNIPAWGNDSAEVTSGIFAKLLGGIVVDSMPQSMCEGDVYDIHYTFSDELTFNAGNTFIAQISDDQGSFTAPTVVGSKNDTEPGLISVTMPNGIPSGTYKIRVISDNPEVNPVTRPVKIVKLLDNKPVIQGDSAVCDGTVSTEYKVKHVGATEYHWSIEPADAASINHQGDMSDSSVVINWYADFASDASLSVTAIGCDTLVSDLFQVHKSPAINAAITRSGDSLFADPLGDQYTYEWLFSGSVIGTEDTIVIDNDGDYRLVVHDQYDCFDTSDVFNVTGVKVHSVASKDEFGVYPNPTTGILNIVSSSQAEMHINVISITGEKVLSASLPAGDQLDIGKLPAGIYFVEMHSGKDKKIIKVQLLSR